jgi:hypothetical protein
LIFKHAISTVVMGRTMPHGPNVAHSDAKTASSSGTTAQAASASGTEG